MVIHRILGTRFHQAGQRNAETEWAHVVSRMRGRAPQWMTDEEAQKILDYLLSLPPPTGGH